MAVGCLASCGCRDGTEHEARGSSPDPILAHPADDIPRQGKVLLVHSYHTGYPWVDAITQGVKRALAARPVELQVFYMDTKRHTDTAWKEQAGRRAREVLDEWRPDVVIAADDNAQQYFASELVATGDTSVVFCGVNSEPEKYGYPAKNVTGILERPHFRESIELLQELYPNARRIALVTDNSPTSRGAIQSIESQQAPCEIVLTRTPTTFDQWQDAIREAQTAADAIAVYMYHTVKRGGQAKSMPPKELMSWTVANSEIPVVGFFIFTVDDGALCGWVESGVEQGYRAAEYALRLMDGTPAADIPLVTATEGQSLVNLNTARRLGISVTDEFINTVDIVVGD